MVMRATRSLSCVMVGLVLAAAGGLMCSCDGPGGGASGADSTGQGGMKKGEASAARSGGVPRIMTTFYPTTYFASRIAGPHAVVVCPLPEGEDPIFWTPTREVIGDYQKADLVLVNGASFEKWTATATLPMSRVVDTAAPLGASLITFETVTHRHGSGGEHTHEGVDGHTWVDPVNARMQAGEIEAALADRYPDHAADFRAGFESLARDLDGLGGSLAELKPATAEAGLLASHPAYNYLARRQGWAITNIAMDPEQAASEAELVAVGAAADAARAAGKRRVVMLWEAEPPAATISALRERFGVESVVFSPCESLGAEERAAGDDYLSIMRRNIESLKAALTGEAVGG